MVFRCESSTRARPGGKRVDEKSIAAEGVKFARNMKKKKKRCENEP
jgi:hypothetical protein